jgi:hypothetical protein
MRRKPLFAALVAVPVIALVVAGLLFLMGSTPQEAAGGTQLTAAAEAFYSAASDGTNDWDNETQILVQLGGASTQESETLTVLELRNRAEAQGWMFNQHYAELDNAMAFFVNDGQVEEISLTGVFPAALDLRTGAVYVASGGYVFQVSPEQPSVIASQIMSNLIERWGTDIDAEVIPWLRSSVKVEETMFGHIGTNLWGENSIWVFLQDGFAMWRPELINEGYANPPWAVNNRWYQEGRSQGTISQGTRMVNAFFPQDLGNRLTATQRILLGFLDDGTVLAPRLNAALGIGTGTQQPPTTTPPPPTTTTPQPQPDPTPGTQPDPTPGPQPPPTTQPPITTPQPPAQRTVSRVEISPMNAERQRGGTVDYTITVVYDDNSRETNPSGAQLHHNGGNHGLTLSSRRLTIGSNTPAGTYHVWATMGTHRSSNAEVRVTIPVEAGRITLRPSTVSVAWNGGSATFIVDSNQSWAVSDWNGFSHTMSRHSGTAGQTSVSVSLPQNPGMMRVWHVVFRTSDGTTATLIINQAANPNATPTFVPADPPPGGVTQPVYGEDTNNSGTPDPIVNPNPGTPPSHTDHPQHNPNDPGHPGQTVNPSDMPLPPTDQDDLVDLTPGDGRPQGWDN